MLRALPSKKTFFLCVVAPLEMSRQVSSANQVFHDLIFMFHRLDEGQGAKKGEKAPNQMSREMEKPTGLVKLF